MSSWLLLFLLIAPAMTSTNTRRNCGGIFTARMGVLQTPNFPKKFPTPADCEWIIKSERENSSIIVYLTQMYVFEGLTFTEYVEYDKRLPGVVILGGEDVVKGKYVQCHKNALVISLKLNSIENNHIRVMDNFMDVYGFNITYEITSGEVRKDHCNMMDCGFTGVCYDYQTKFGCQCFPGYSGPSCSDGPKSGCSNPDGMPLCQNEAFCRHIGDSFIKCECPEGFTGEYCSSSTRSEDEETKLVSCLSNNRKAACQCEAGENISTNDLYAYTGVVQLKAFTISQEVDLRTYMSKEIMSNLQSNTTKIRDLLITDLESSATELGVTFRFYGSKASENHLRSVINKWGEVGLIGNMTVANPDIALYKEPIILSIQSVGVNPSGIIHQDDDFVLSCSAQGSPNMSFRWYKDGMFVNITQFKNNKWVTLRKGSSLTNYLAILTVDKATALDGGLFTCQVEDFNIQQCLSKRVEIRSKPTVVLDVMSLTVAKGESFSVKCSSYNSGGTSIYSWTKNGHLLPTKTRRERYDTLYLTGSLLRVSGLSKSANYSCLVQDRTTKSEMTVTVIVVDKKRIKTCLKDFLSNVTWPETAPGYESIQNCPQGYGGFARRMCIMLDGSSPQWDRPDMSECVSYDMEPIIRDFEYLRLGYEAASPLQILSRTSNYLRNSNSLDGEGAVVINLISNLISYINKSNSSVDIRNVCAAGFDALDKVLLQTVSLIKETQVNKLQRVAKDLLFTCKRFLPLIDTFTHVGHSLLANMHPVNKLTNFRSDLFSKNTKITFELTFVEEDKQYFESLTSVIYFNLKNFLPQRSILRINDSELDYIIVSDIVATWFINDEVEIEFLKSFTFNLQFQVNNSLASHQRNLTCVQSDFAPFGYYWNKTACDTKTIDETTINCRCYKFGTFTIIATRDTSLEMENTIDTPHRIIILLGCSTCLLLAIFSALLLIFHWIFHQNCITYLKSQCCCSIIGAMTVFILVQTNNIKNDSYLYINTLLQIFFLTSVSTQLNILLIIYSDFLKFKNSRNVRPTSICIVTGAPIIIILGNYISHVSMNLKLYSWWLIVGSASFYLFAICCLILSILYTTLYCIIVKCIRSKKSINVSKDRIILLRKSFYIFHALILVIITSVLYINVIENIMCHFVFSVTAMCLGIVLLFCYALKVDDVIEQYFLKRITLKKNGDSKKGSITLNYIPNTSRALQDDSTIDTSQNGDQQLKRQSGSPKHATINKQKQLRATIKTPDILNTDSCVNLDLVPPSVEECKHNGPVVSPSPLKEERPVQRNNQEAIHTVVNSNPHISNRDSKTNNISANPELLPQCSKVCVQEVKDCAPSSSESVIPSVAALQTVCTENLDSVMCSISNDLDFLLNRTCDFKSS